MLKEGLSKFEKKKKYRNFSFIFSLMGIGRGLLTIEPNSSVIYYGLAVLPFIAGCYFWYEVSKIKGEEKRK